MSDGNLGHTAGPWSYDGPHHSIIVWGPDPELRVCFMTSDGPSEANARLIAAAPDLLAAAIGALSIIEGFEPEHGGIATDAELATLRAAIAKATQP